jgi:hypothetical protein
MLNEMETADRKRGKGHSRLSLGHEDCMPMVLIVAVTCAAAAAAAT